MEAREDTDFDGTVDVVTRYRHEQPEEVTWEARPGAPRRQIRFLLGQRLDELRDLDGDGEFDWRVEFNEFAYPVREGPVE